MVIMRKDRHTYREIKEKLSSLGKKERYAYIVSIVLLLVFITITIITAVADLTKIMSVMHESGYSSGGFLFIIMIGLAISIVVLTFVVIILKLLFSLFKRFLKRKNDEK